MTLKISFVAPLGVPVLAKRSLRHALPGGSRVLAARGEVQVESLTAGDRIITRDYGMAVVRRMIRMKVEAGSPFVHIPANAMGQGRPDRDVVLPAHQPVVLRGWRARTIFGAKEARVAAQRLVDGTVIRRIGARDGAVWCIVLDHPAAIYVDGLELVSGAMDAVEPRTAKRGS